MRALKAPPTALASSFARTEAGVDIKRLILIPSPECDLPMKPSPRRERRWQRLRVRWPSSSRHGQFQFPVFASGLIVIVFAHGPLVPSNGAGQRPQQGDNDHD